MDQETQLGEDDDSVDKIAFHTHIDSLRCIKTEDQTPVEFRNVGLDIGEKN